MNEEQKNNLPTTENKQNALTDASTAHDQVEQENLDQRTVAVVLPPQETKGSKRRRHNKNLHIAFTIAMAAFLRAVALELLLIPNNITVGGAVGIASIFTWVFKDALPPLTGVYLFAVNIPLLILAFFKTDRGFVIKTGVCLVLMSIFMETIELTRLSEILQIANTQGETKVLYALLGGALSGVSLPLMLSIQASTGGSDIITMLLQKHKNGSNYLRLILYIDIFTIVVAAAASQWLVKGGDGMAVLIYSVATQFTAHLVQNQIYKGYSSAYGLDIITDKPKQVAEALSDNLHRGLTGLKVTGMYSHTEKTLIMCVIYKRQLNRARKIVREADPNAFATVYTVKEVVGLGFRNTDEDIEDKVIKAEPIRKKTAQKDKQTENRKIEK